jgi:proteic killer suppression protein
MEILFNNTKLAKVLNEEARMKRAYGEVNAKYIRLRLAVLAAAPTLADVPAHAPERCHQLTGDRKGSFAVVVQQPYRIVFEPAHDPVPRTADGGIDLARVTAINILEIVDYH